MGGGMTGYGKYMVGIGMLGLALLASVSRAAPPPNRAATACVGVPDAERYVGLFTDPSGLLAAEEIRRMERMSETEPPDDRAGARLVLVARPGMTAEWLQRVAECHLARNVSRGVPPTSRSPLDVPGAAVLVSSTGN